MGWWHTHTDHGRINGDRQNGHPIEINQQQYTITAITAAANRKKMKWNQITCVLLGLIKDDDFHFLLSLRWALKSGLYFVPKKNKNKIQNITALCARLLSLSIFQYLLFFFWFFLLFHSSCAAKYSMAILQRSAYRPRMYNIIVIYERGVSRFGASDRDHFSTWRHIPTKTDSTRSGYTKYTHSYKYVSYVRTFCAQICCYCMLHACWLLKLHLSLVRIFNSGCLLEIRGGNRFLCFDGRCSRVGFRSPDSIFRLLSFPSPSPKVVAYKAQRTLLFCCCCMEEMPWRWWIPLSETEMQFWASCVHTRYEGPKTDLLAHLHF